MPLKQHLKAHGVVHACWLFAVLLGIIAALILIMPHGEVIRDYISFASSIASIILAILAIIYAMFSSQSLSELIGSLRTSAQRTEDSSRAIESVGTNFVSLANRITDELQGLSPKFDALDSKIDQRLSPETLSSLQPKNDDTDSILDDSGMTSGLEASLYVLKKMQDTDKAFDVGDTTLSQRFRDYIAGVLTAITFLRPFGSVIEKLEGAFKVVSLRGPLKKVVDNIDENEDLSDVIKGPIDVQFASDGGR